MHVVMQPAEMRKDICNKILIDKAGRKYRERKVNLTALCPLRVVSCEQCWTYKST
jgi:hypothetical protein